MPGEESVMLGVAPAQNEGFAYTVCPVMNRRQKRRRKPRAAATVVRGDAWRASRMSESASPKAETSRPRP